MHPGGVKFTGDKESITAAYRLAVLLGGEIYPNVSAGSLSSILQPVDCMLYA
jgi:hypothetical protein